MSINLDFDRVVLKYVGDGVRVREVPARDLTAEDLSDLEEYHHESLFKTPFRSLREFLLSTNLYQEEEVEVDNS